MLLTHTVYSMDGMVKCSGLHATHTVVSYLNSIPPNLVVISLYIQQSLSSRDILKLRYYNSFLSIFYVSNVKSRHHQKLGNGNKSVK